jgi:hypothetical protein
MIGFTGTSLQLQSIMTAHNQWLSKTRSVPYWTTSVFSSAVTNDERRITGHTMNCLLTSELRLPNEFCRAFSSCPPFITSCGPNRDHLFQQFTLLREPCANSAATLCFTIPAFRRCIPNRCLANGHIRHRPLTRSTTRYKEVLTILREWVRRKRPEMWKNGSWILYLDNAPAHNALSVKLFLAKHKIPVLEHPPHSPDLIQRSSLHLKEPVSSPWMQWVQKRRR